MMTKDQFSKLNIEMKQLEEYQYQQQQWLCEQTKFQAEYMQSSHFREGRKHEAYEFIFRPLEDENDAANDPMED